MLLLNDLLWVNFYWGVMNLLPVYPLDGGQAARALFEHRGGSRGRRRSLVVSAIVAAAVALLGLAEQNYYLLLLFGMLAVSSVQALESVSPRSFPRPYRR
jgi:membrane-associated protease RseP (regulator of RpoE activity)